MKVATPGSPAWYLAMLMEAQDILERVSQERHKAQVEGRSQGGLRFAPVHAALGSIVECERSVTEYVTSQER